MPCILRSAAGMQTTIFYVAYPGLLLVCKQWHAPSCILQAQALGLTRDSMLIVVHACLAPRAAIWHSQPDNRILLRRHLHYQRRSAPPRGRPGQRKVHRVDRQGRVPGRAGDGEPGRAGKHTYTHMYSSSGLLSLALSKCREVMGPAHMLSIMPSLISQPRRRIIMHDWCTHLISAALCSLCGPQHASLVIVSCTDYGTLHGLILVVSFLSHIICADAYHILGSY